jgi:hypothetical protein
MTLCVSAFMLAGCKSTSGKGSQGGSENAVDRGEMVVSVEGASSSREGDTLKIDYPVLKDKNDRIPDWVINPGLGGVTGAVGVAAMKGLGTREQIDEARLNGRLELVSMLETRVQGIGRMELEENARATGKLTEDSRKNVLGIDRDIIDSVLSGTRQRALWFDPMNDECFVWMVLDGSLRDVVDHYVVEDVSVFVASTPISSDYRPERRKPEVPRVIIEQAEPAPLPAPPTPELTPAEELEKNLKPIETIPSEEKPTEGDG